MNPLFSVEFDTPFTRYVVTFDNDQTLGEHARLELVNGLVPLLRPNVGTVSQLDDLTYEITN